MVLPIPGESACVFPRWLLCSPRLFISFQGCHPCLIDKILTPVFVSFQVTQQAIPPLPQPTIPTCIQPAALATPQVKILKQA